jgi:NADH-quinone oxidoreductase subunit L
MFVPLAVLAILALTAGLPFIAKPLSPAYLQPEHLIHFGFVTFVSVGAVVLGVVAAFLLYAGKDKDPLSIPLFRERFYIDRFYDNIVVRYFQDAFAAIVHFFDELLINGLLAGGLSRGAVSFGNLFRKLQSGQLQGYAYAFGLGVVLVIYFTVFI